MLKEVRYYTAEIITRRRWGDETQGAARDSRIGLCTYEEKIAKLISTKSAERRRTPEKIVQNALKLQDISETSNVPPEQVLKELPSAIKELKTCRASLIEVNDNIEKAKIELEKSQRKGRKGIRPLRVFVIAATIEGKKGEHPGNNQAF